MIMSTPKAINTARLSLHQITDSDADRLISLLKEPEIGKTYMVPDFRSHKDELRLFEVLKKLSASSDRFVYGIYLENELIGLINDVEINGGEIELGFVIHPDHKNRGFATEVLSASIKELFLAGYSVVKTGAFEENSASIRVMEKCGMTRLDKTEDIEYRGKIHRCILFKKTNK